jgi:hypothetical protein
VKAAAVAVGGVYYTKVGEEKVAVQVIGIVVGDLTGRRTFRVQRLDRGTYLPKLRTAAALHPRLELWTGFTSPQD